MKQILYILLALMMLSCSQNSKRSGQDESIKLDESAITSTEESFDFYSDSVLTSIDAEELCELNFDFFLPQLNHKLTEKDLKLDVQIADDYESSFEIAINGRQVKLYKKEELSDGKFWDSGPRNFFRTVNEILSDKNVDKQFYLLYGGNDLSAVFLTKEQFELMSKLNEGDEYETPYLP